MAVEPQHAAQHNQAQDDRSERGKRAFEPVRQCDGTDAERDERELGQRHSAAQRFRFGIAERARG